MSAPILQATLLVVLVGGGSLFFYALFSVMDAIKGDASWRAERDKARRMARKPGPSKREEERKLIRARMVNLQADIAAGRIAPLGERYRREPRWFEKGDRK